MKTISLIEIHPVTPDRWSDLEALFGKSGACYGCWCMWWRVTNKEFIDMKAEGHKEAIRTLVQQGNEPGLIAYAEGVPAGWVTVAPRADYVRLKTSRMLAAVDDLPVWSIPCFFVHKSYRRAGMTVRLIEAALEYAKAHGATVVEAYPHDVDKVVNPMNLFTGAVSAFVAAGFVEVARRKPGRPVMRKTL